MFPDSPYGHSLYGHEADLKSLSRKDITQFYESIMNSGSLSLLVITDLERKALQEILTRHLSWVKTKVSPDRKGFRAAEGPPEKKSDRGAVTFIRVLPVPP